jgi:hypothetical protein
MFGRKWGEVTGGWIKLEGEEFHKFNSSPDIVR